MKPLPSHLGGHANVNHVDSGALKYIQETFDVKSLLDIGCGLGKMGKLCEERNIKYKGIDGDYTIDRAWDVSIHDYTLGPRWHNDKKYDLAWSTEFVEHVNEQYIPNYMEDFALCEYALITYAPPNTPGHHHVNCQTQEYWFDIFSKYGFKYNDKHTQKIREVSTMKRGNKKKFVAERGLFFEKK